MIHPLEYLQEIRRLRTENDLLTRALCMPREPILLSFILGLYHSKVLLRWGSQRSD